MPETASTIVVVREGAGMDFNRYVDRVFKTKEAAWKWRNAQPRNHTIRRLDGRWKVGQTIPLGTPSTAIDPT